MALRKKLGRLTALATAVTLSGQLLGAFQSNVVLAAKHPAETVHPYATASAPSGYAVQIDSGGALTAGLGCTTVSTGVAAAMAEVEVSVVGGAKAAKVSVGSNRFAVAAGTAVSASVWVPLDSSGAFSVCLPKGLTEASIQLMAQTVAWSSSQPGGLVAVTARIPLVTTANTTSGTTSGTWSAPPDATPTSAQGLILQVSSATAGSVEISSGSASTNVQVGPSAPATTLWLPGGTVNWMTASSAIPDAVMLGFVTSSTDGTTAGALMNVLASPLKRRGKGVQVAGSAGIPTSGAQIPATSVIANIAGSDPSVVDPLAEGRLVPTGAVSGSNTQTILRLTHDNSLHFTSTTAVNAIAWLGGDIVHAAGSIDLTQSGSPQPSAAAATTLTFPGLPSFAAGEALVVGDTRATPNGLIALVDAVSNNGTDTIVTYHDGGLLDGFSVIGLVAQLPASGPDASEPLSARQRSISASVTSGLDWSATSSIKLGTNPSVSGQVSLDFAPSVTLSVNVSTGWLGLPSSLRIRYAVDVGSSATASLTASGSWSGSKTFTLLDKPLAVIDFGWFAVVPILDVSVTFEASASASASISGTISDRIHDGLTAAASLGGGFSIVGDGNNSIQPPTTSTTGLETSVSASADATLGADLTLAIDGVAGPDASATLEVALNVNPGSSPAWAITVSGDFKVGVNLNAMNIPLLSWALSVLGVPTHPSWTLGHLGPYVVNSGSGGTGGQAGGGGGAGTGGTGPTGGSGGGGGGSGPPAFPNAPPGASVTMTEGPAATYGYRYGITLTGYQPNSAVGIECYDSQDPNGFYGFYLTTDGSGNASTSSYCFSASGPYYWVVAGGVTSNQIAWNTSSGPPPPTAGEAIEIGWSTAHPSWLYMTLSGFTAGTYTYTCNFASGGDASYQVTLSGYDETFDNGMTCNDAFTGDVVWVTIGSVVSNSITVGGGSPQPSGPQSIQIGWSSSHPSWIYMTLTGFTPGTYTYSCDFTSGGDASYQVSVNATPEMFDNGKTCNDAIGGDQVWVAIGSVQSNTITVGSSPPPGSSIQIGWSTAHPSWIYMTLTGFTSGTYTYTCNFASGGDASYQVSVNANPQTFDNGATCNDAISGDQVWVTIGSVQSNTITVGGNPPPQQYGPYQTTTAVNVRSGPGTNYSVIGGLAGGATFYVYCQASGTDINNNVWWDNLTSGGYISDYYTNTPGVGPPSSGIPQC